MPHARPRAHARALARANPKCAARRCPAGVCAARRCAARRGALARPRGVMASAETETERIKAEVTKAFALFQAHESSPEVDEREVPTILASLGLNLTQEMLRDFVNEVRGEDSTTGLLSFDRFAKAATRVLLEHRQGEAARDSEEKLLRAFKVRERAIQHAHERVCLRMRTCGACSPGAFAHSRLRGGPCL